jgi:DNA-binding LacI/PurR family transcriptional regulator
MTTTRATQRDIAQKAGVGHTTVSLALRGHPKIPAETRRRILGIAEELGYAPDPMLSALAMYRSGRRAKVFQGKLAWLVNVVEDFDWKKGPYYVGYCAGASRRASYYGYELEEFYLDRAQMSASRLATILRARNVNGLLLCPQGRPEMELEFTWQDFSAVTFGYSLGKPLLHTVASAHFLNTKHVMREMAARGYRRPGLVINRQLDQRCGSNVHAGYLIEQELHPDFARVPPFLDYDAIRHDPPALARKLADYIRTHRLDAIVTANYQLLDVLKLAGISAPGDISVAGLSLPAAKGRMSGVVEDSERIGEAGVDILVGMIQRGERGVPPIPIRTHLEGSWHEAETLPGRA